MDGETGFIFCYPRFFLPKKIFLALFPSQHVTISGGSRRSALRWLSSFGSQVALIVRLLFSVGAFDGGLAMVGG